MAQTAAGLPEWTEEQRTAYIEHRAKGHSQPAARDLVLDCWPEAKKYQQQRLSRFETLVGTKAKIVEHEDSLEVRRLPFARRRQRVAALGQLAMTLQNKIDEEKASGTPTALGKLSAEFRSTLSNIRDEMEHLAGARKSWAEELMDAIAEKKSEVPAEPTN